MKKIGNMITSVAKTEIILFHVLYISCKAMYKRSNRIISLDFHIFIY